MVAPSRDQAWAIGYAVRSGQIAGHFLEHWSGRRWQMMKVPGSHLRPAAVAASGPDDVWLFSSANRAFRWDGRRWAAAPGTLGLPMADPVVLGSADVWTGGGGACNTTNLYNWTGSGWTRYTLPYGVARPSGSSSAGLWLLTVPVSRTCKPVSGAPLTLRHWNGSSFAKARIPAIPDRPKLGTYFAVSSGHDIWVANATGSLILHWDGRRWNRLPKAPQYVPPGQIVPDGRGGAWIGGCAHWSGGTWHFLSGRDTCGETFGLARIPGTRSAWRLSVSTYNNRTEGTIEVNGRLP